MAGGRAQVVDTLAVESTGANAVIVGGTVGASSGTGGLKGGTISDSVGSMATIRAGGIGIASQATLDLITAGSATQLARIAAGSALQVPRINAAGNGWEFTSPLVSAMTLIGSAQGSTTSGVAANLATFAISGLTVKDAIFAQITISNTGNTGTTPQLYNVTDSVSICDVNTVNASANGCRMWISTNGTSTTQVVANGTRDTTNDNTISTFTTAWTGSWTLAYRIPAGITGGTHIYNVRIWKLAGQ